MNDTETLKEFYPTPPELIAKMLKGIVPHSNMYVLEPSAGKGDIALFWERALDYISDHWRWREIDPDNEMDTSEVIEKIIDTSVVNSFKDNREHYINDRYLGKVDCIEINPVLRDVLKGRDLRVVDFNFLTYNGDKKYDLILMNPPFSNGDEHLLKAIEIGEKYGSKIICILNAETIRNPYSNKRKALLQKLNNYKADIEFCTEAFSDAERKTNVEIAIVRVQCPKPTFDGSKVFENLKEKAEGFVKPENCKELITGKEIEQAVLMYKTEIEVGKKLIGEYLSLSPYISSEFEDENCENHEKPKPVLLLNVAGKSLNKDFDFNDFVYAVRYKYWKKLLYSANFLDNLTYDLQQDYRGRVNEYANYDFSLSNIYEVQIQVVKDTVKGIEDNILKLFESFTYKYSTECDGNIHYFNGWKTNKAFIINKKVIQPIYAWSNIFNKFRYDYDVCQRFADMEKVFDNLMGESSDLTDMYQRFATYEKNQNTKNLHFKYFDITFYKKGTAHITFTNEKALKLLNIFGCQRKGWLPPSYGKKSYEEMDDEERSVVDEFEGEKSYRNVIAHANEYIISSCEKLLSLPE